MVLSIRKAEESDTEIIGSIFAVARQFMARTGNPTQWGNSSPDMNLVAGDIRRKESYVIESDGKLSPPSPWSKAGIRITALLTTGSTI